MNRNGMVTFEELESLRLKLLCHNVEIRHVDGARLAVVAQGNAEEAYIGAPLGKLESACGMVIERSKPIKLLVRIYDTTHDDSKAVLRWIVAQAAIAFAKVDAHNERLYAQDVRRIEFLKRYAEETAKRIDVPIPAQPLHAAFAFYMLESSTWM